MRLLLAALAVLALAAAPAFAKPRVLGSLTANVGLDQTWRAPRLSDSKQYQGVLEASCPLGNLSVVGAARVPVTGGFASYQLGLRYTFLRAGKVVL